VSAPEAASVIIPAAAVEPAPNAAAAPPASNPAAPGVYRLTLEDARQRAVASNSQLGLANLNIEEKRHALAAARKDYLPKFLGSDTYFHFDSPLGSVITFQRGQRGILPVGSLTANVPVLNQDGNLLALMAAQPITKLIAVNVATQVARADENIARAQLEKGTKEVLSGVTQAYYGLVGAQRILSTLELQAPLLEQALAAKPTPELRIALLELKQGILQTKGQVQELTGTLNSLLDLPPNTVLEPVDPLPAAPTVHSADEAAQQALACSPEIREAEENIAKAHAARRLARMDYLPDVNVIGGYANQTALAAVQQNIGFLGVTASYTFWDWGKRGDVRRQRETDIALANQSLRVAREKVEGEARKSFGAFEQAREALRLAEEMVKARKEAEKGAATPASIAETKQATAKAQLELMKAEIAYRVAHTQLAAAVGQ
jgi:outer membrane protein TolC